MEFPGYFGYFRSCDCILVIRVFQVYFGHYGISGVILVILEFFGLFLSFQGFSVILVIMVFPRSFCSFQELFGHFRGSKCILGMGKTQVQFFRSSTLGSQLNLNTLNLNIIGNDNIVCVSLVNTTMCLNSIRGPYVSNLRNCILVLPFRNYGVSGVNLVILEFWSYLIYYRGLMLFWSFWSFRDYFGHYGVCGVILVIFQFFGLFWSFYGFGVILVIIVFQGYFVHLGVFGVIFVILEVLCACQSL